MWNPFKKKEAAKEESASPASPATPASPPPGADEDYVPDEEPGSPVPTTGEWITSAEEKLKVMEMKARLPPDALPGTALDISFDWTLTRFIRARKGDIAAAIEMYLNMLKWRKENNIDGMLNTPDPNEHIFGCICPHAHHGFDKDGHPVYFERTGLVRVPNMLKFMEEKDIAHRHTRYMEHVIRRMIQSSQKLGRYIGKQVVVYDMSGLSYKVDTAGMRVFKQTSNVDQNYYPESLHRMFIINAPMSFRAIWAMVRPFLDPVTQKKVEIMGHKYLDRLREFIDESNIPVLYGGKCTCPGLHANGDPCLPEVRDPGKTVPADLPAPWPHIPIDKEAEIQPSLATAAAAAATAAPPVVDASSTIVAF